MSGEVLILNFFLKNTFLLKSFKNIFEKKGYFLFKLYVHVNKRHANVIFFSSFDQHNPSG